MPSFQERVLTVTLTLSNGIVFNSTNSNTLIIDNLRVVANISQSGLTTTGSADIAIFGMLESDMNQLTSLQFDTVGANPEVFRNTVTVAADGVVCYTGTIINCYGIYHNQPDVYLHISAATQFFDKINPAQATCYPGAVDVASIMADFAKQMNLQLENNGVNIQSEFVYYTGSLLTQAQKVAEHNNFDMFIEGFTMVIIPRGGTRSQPVALLSKDTGLVGYPSFDNAGVTFKCLFNPMIHFHSTVEIDSPIIRANGYWVVNSLRYTLESQKPGGAWFMDARAAKGPNYAQ